MVIIWAILNGLIRSLISVKRKLLRKNNINSLSILTIFCFALPLWLVTLFILSHYFDIVLSKIYLIYVFIWASIVIITEIIWVYLYKFQALLEFKIYSLVFGVFLSILIDYFYFNSSLSLSLLISIVLFFIAAILIYSNKKPQVKDIHKKDIKYFYGILSILFIGLLNIWGSFLYKTAVLLQTNPIIHGTFSQIIVFGLVLIIGFKPLIYNIKNGNIKKNNIINLTLLIFLYTIIEPFLYEKLPLTIIALLWIIQLVVFSFYDIKNKEFLTTWKIVLSGLLVISALIVMNI